MKIDATSKNDVQDNSNADYLAMLHRSEKEAEEGKLINKTLNELEELAK